MHVFVHTYTGCYTDRIEEQEDSSSTFKLASLPSYTATGLSKFMVTFKYPTVFETVFL